MAARYCSLCGGENPPEVLECQECGAPLPEPGPELEPEEITADGEAGEVPVSRKKSLSRLILPVLAVFLLLGGVTGLLLWRFWPDKPAFAAKSETEGAYLGGAQGGTLVISSVLYPYYDPAGDIVTENALLKVGEGNSGCQSADGSRGLYYSWDGVWALYDRGKLEQIECQKALLSGDGRYLFLLTDPPEESSYYHYGRKITRRDLETGETLVVAEGGKGYGIEAAGYDGSRLFYTKNGESEWNYGVWIEGNTRWVEQSYQTVPGSAGGAIFQDSLRWSDELKYLQAGIGWPKENGEIALQWRRLGAVCYDKGLTAFLYQEETGNWFVETAQGRRSVTGLGREVKRLEPLRPSRSEELPERVLDWVYIAGDGGLYYLSADCEATFLGQAAYYRATGAAQTTAIDPQGNTVYYLFGGEVFRIDRPRKRSFSVTQLTQETRATRLYADRALDHVYFQRGDALYYLPQGGQPVEVCAGGEQTAVQVMEDGGCWVGVSQKTAYTSSTVRVGRLLRLQYFSADGALTDTGLLVDRLIPLGERALVAVRVEDGKATAWRLEKGEATELPRQEELTLPPYEPPVYGELDEDAADLSLDGEKDWEEWVGPEEDVEAAVPEDEEIPEGEKRVMWAVVIPEDGTNQVGAFISGGEGDIDLDDIRSQIQIINGGTVEYSGENAED